MWKQLIPTLAFSSYGHSLKSKLICTVKDSVWIQFFSIINLFLFFSDAKHSCRLFATNAYDKKLNYWSSFSILPFNKFPSKDLC